MWPPTPHGLCMNGPPSCRASTLPGCTLQEKCEQWAKAGECEKNKEYMEETCKRACNKCSAYKPPDESLKPKGADLAKNLEEMARKLQQDDGGQQVRVAGHGRGPGRTQGVPQGQGEGLAQGQGEGLAQGKEGGLGKGVWKAVRPGLYPPA